MTAPDPTILAAAIKCASEDLHLQRDIDDPEVNKVRALVAAAKAYQVMREALEQLATFKIDVSFMADHLVWVKGLARAALNGEELGWQPIETAPKDGMPLLLGTMESEETAAVSTLGWWQDAEDDGRDTKGADGGFVDHTFNQFYPGRSFGNPTYQHTGNQPTHWMPLPAPPIERAEREPILEKLRSLSTDAACIKGTPMVPLHKSTVAAAADEIERLSTALQLYAGLAGRLYATLEFAVSDLEAALAVIPDHQEIVRRRLTLRVSATKEFLDQNRILPAAALNPAGPA